MLIAETCQSCGVPVWLGHSEMDVPGVSGIEFDTDTANCYACAALEAFRAEQRKANDGKPEKLYGQTEYVVPTGWQAIDGKAVSSADYLPTREAAYKDMAIKAQNRADRAAEAEGS